MRGPFRPERYACLHSLYTLRDHVHQAVTLNCVMTEEKEGTHTQASCIHKLTHYSPLYFNYIILRICYHALATCKQRTRRNPIRSKDCRMKQVFPLEKYIYIYIPLLIYPKYRLSEDKRNDGIQVRIDVLSISLKSQQITQFFVFLTAL